MQSHGWPEPTLADSGNGWHLLYSIDLPNDEDDKKLIEAFLVRLKQLFPMVDSGNSNASRLTKLYGTWARKGEHTEERPWRRSAIVKVGSNTVVTQEQIRALAPESLSVVSATRKVDDVKLANLLGFLDGGHQGSVGLWKERT